MRNETPDSWNTSVLLKEKLMQKSGTHDPLPTFWNVLLPFANNDFLHSLFTCVSQVFGNQGCTINMNVAQIFQVISCNNVASFSHLLTFN